MSNLNPGGLTRVLNYIKTWVTGLLNGKANSSHTHTKSQITDFPTIPSKTSQLTNDSGFLTAHQSLSNYSTLANTVKSLSISGKTITVTPGSGSAYTLTTQDTVYTHPTTAGNKHIPSGGSANQYLKYSESGTAVWANLPTIPSKTSQLTNDSGYITSTGSCSYSTTSGTSTYSTYLKSLGAQTPKSGRDIFHSGVYTYTTFTDTNTPAHYGAVIGYGNGQGGSCEMFAEWVGSGQLWFRVLRDYQDSWTNWQQIITSNNIGSQSVNYANSAGSVAWNNVSGKPSTFTPSSHTHDDRYYTESEINTKLSSKSDTSHNHNSTYLGISAKAESAKVADYAKLLTYSHTNEINFKGGRQATCYFNYRNADDDSTGTAATVEYKFCNYGGNSVSNVTVSAGTFKENGSSLADKYQAKGSYASSSHTHTKSQITDFPTIPTVNNATLTIQKNGSNVATFTANASSNVTANISVPTNTNQLTNGNGFITSAIKESSYGNNENYCLLYGDLLIQFGTNVIGAQSGSISFKKSFSGTPIVVVNYGDDVGYASPCCLDEAYTTYFTVKQETNSGLWRVNWIAIGKKG